VSMMFGVKGHSEETAIQALYHEFFWEWDFTNLLEKGGFLLLIKNIAK
jgi:hypothetical protein